MKCIILAGGYGTRLSEKTVDIPKPMVEIGEKPLLWHIMKIYSFYGFNEFIVTLGYKGEYIKNYFLNYYYLRNNLSINLGDGKIDIYEADREDWNVHLIDTGLDTQSGGRIKRVKEWIGNETFMMTYGDGVADINIKELVEFHRSHKKLATVSSVRPPARFGVMDLDGNTVNKFVEKSQIGEGWINGGFFVLEPEVFDYISEDNSTIFEREPLENLAKDNQLVAYKHRGFWHCMDTLRDVKLLNYLWESDSPWKVWSK